MKICKLNINKLSTAQPVVELQSTVTDEDNRSVASLYLRNHTSKKWEAINHPDYQSEFSLNEAQANDIKLTLDDLVDTYANGNKEKGFHSMLTTSIDCNLGNELSWPKY